MAKMEPMLLTVEQLSQYLSIKRSTIYAWVERRIIPHYKIQRSVRFKKEEIDQWIERLKRTEFDPGLAAEALLDNAKSTLYNSPRKGETRPNRQGS